MYRLFTSIPGILCPRRLPLNPAAFFSGSDQQFHRASFAKRNFRPWLHFIKPCSPIPPSLKRRPLPNPSELARSLQRPAAVFRTAVEPRSATIQGHGQELTSQSRPMYHSSTAVTASRSYSMAIPPSFATLRYASELAFFHVGPSILRMARHSNGVVLEGSPSKIIDS